ncbi:hypothetical protein H6G89_19120 [Oscillatoria sp. FACHB-1407]|uniref:hypothetical protein n=1 Tax=Oscillatoria sp. FACHB-1407 TaxID=2692847 RepID=UPI0016887FAC|nr:hypothetical protein [Oscillatoria sp. FACHB-1407]MBD2463151.1 hypothetical protein [Oscillatoria sp. FACHB-1407]
MPLHRIITRLAILPTLLTWFLIAWQQTALAHVDPLAAVTELSQKNRLSKNYTPPDTIGGPDRTQGSGTR